jgi:hypothetical protein
MINWPARLLVLMLVALAPSIEAPRVAHQLVVPTGSGARAATFWLASGFEIHIFAAGLPDARMLAESPSGELVLSQNLQGRVANSPAVRPPWWRRNGAPSTGFAGMKGRADGRDGVAN